MGLMKILQAEREELEAWALHFLCDEVDALSECEFHGTYFEGENFGAD